MSKAGALCGWDYFSLTLKAQSVNIHNFIEIITPATSFNFNIIQRRILGLTFLTLHRNLHRGNLILPWINNVLRNKAD